MKGKEKKRKSFCHFHFFLRNVKVVTPTLEQCKVSFACKSIRMKSTKSKMKKRKEKYIQNYIYIKEQQYQVEYCMRQGNLHIISLYIRSVEH